MNRTVKVLLVAAATLSACSSQISTGDFEKPEENLPPTDRVIRQPAVSTGAFSDYPQPEYNGVKYDFMLPGEQTKALQSSETQQSNLEKITHGEILGKDGQPLSAEEIELFKKGCSVYQNKTTKEYACFGCIGTTCTEASWRYEEVDRESALSSGHMCMRTEEGCELYVLPSPDASLQPIIDEATDLLAKELEREKGDIQFLSIESIDWPDACLGIVSAEVFCAQVVTPGYRIYLTVGTVLYEYRSNAAGDVLTRNILRK